MNVKGKPDAPALPARFTGISADNLLWAAWDEGFSVYSRATGETHQFSALPAEALRRLESGTLSIDALAKDLARACEAPDSPEWRQKITAVVAELERLELIKRLT